MEQRDLIAPERKKPPPRPSELRAMVEAGPVEFRAASRPASRKKRATIRQAVIRWPYSPWLLAF